MTIETLPLENTSTAVEALSAGRDEPAWMLEQRQKAWRFFEEIPWPVGNEETWRRTKLTGFKLEDYRPLAPLGAAGDPEVAYLPAGVQHSLDEVKSGSSLALIDGRAALHTIDPALAAQGVIHTDLHSALREHPELLQKYLGMAVATDENKFSALHYALWNGGTFLYVPRNVQVEAPLQTCL